MRSAFGNWLIERRIARVALIAALLPIFGVLSAAIVVCVAVVKGWRVGLTDCGIALALLTGLTLLAGQVPTQALFSGVSTWGVALLLGGITGIYGSLTLAVQALVILFCIAVFGFAVITGDTAAFWQPFLQTLNEQIVAMGIELAQPDALFELAPIMTGLFAAGTIISSIMALLLGCWWAGGARSRSAGELFIEFRLGYVIGGIAVLAGIAGLFGLQPLAQNLLLTAGIGFLFQGLAVLHWHAARRQWPWYALIPFYLPFLLGPSFFVLAMLMYTAVGFFDNWFGLRRLNQT